MDLVFFHRAVGLMNPDHQAQSERRGRDTDHDRGENEHVGKRVRVDRIPFREDRCGPSPNLAHADVEDEDGCLKNAQPHDLLDQVPVRDQDVETDHHQEDEDPVVHQSQDVHERTCRRPANA